MFFHSVVSTWHHSCSHFILSAPHHHRGDTIYGAPVSWLSITRNKSQRNDYYNIFWIKYARIDGLSSVVVRRWCHCMCGLIFHFWRITKEKKSKTKKKTAGFFLCWENNHSAWGERGKIHRRRRREYAPARNASRSYHLKELCVEYVCRVLMTMCHALCSHAWTEHECDVNGCCVCVMHSHVTWTRYQDRRKIIRAMLRLWWMFWSNAIHSCDEAASLHENENII